MVVLAVVGVAASSVVVTGSGFASSASAPCGTNGSFSAPANSCAYGTVGTDTFTVPAGVAQVTFDVFASQGGGGNNHGGGGLGGNAKATLNVTPGSTFQIVVGAGGGASADGATGGGASDVRSGGCAATSTCGLADRIVVAGGGGGGGACSLLSITYGQCRAGNGGAGSGGNGDSAGSNDCYAGGGGATSTGGGAGAIGSPLLGGGQANGASGALGVGGLGGGWGGQSGNAFPGGAGGDGYYGGGGGGGGTSVSSCDAGGGGGGSGYITSSAVVATTASGVQSGSGRITITMSGATSTTTSLSSSSNPSTVGGQVIYTATVSPAPSGGTVQFSDGGTIVSGCPGQPINASGVATCAVTYPGAGAHSIAAAYSGNTSYLASNSTALAQTVNAASGTATALSSSANPSTAGQPVIYTATVTPTVDGGTVQFRDGGTGIPNCLSQIVNTSTGIATCAVTYTVIGSHSITAAYGGNPSFPASTSAALSQTVNASVTTSTVVGSSLNPSVAGQQITYTATISPAPDGGTVAFSDGGIVITGCGSRAVNSSNGTATCAVTYAAAGGHTITASYGGDASYPASSSSPLTQAVNPLQTRTTLTSSSNPSGIGEQVIYTATVRPVEPATGNPTGTIAFSDGGVAIPGCTSRAIDASSGVATCAVTYDTGGSHAVGAAYGGDATYPGSLSIPVTQTVNTALPSYSTPGSYVFTVPPGVSQVTFDVFGAQGAGGTHHGGGGLGGEARGTLAVTPGQTFQIVVGGAGSGGDGTPYAGGGGASDVRAGGCAATSSCTLADRILVAGGGGGGGLCSFYTGSRCRAGGGGAGSGANGANGGTNDCYQGGGGGTDTAGGYGGAGSPLLYGANANGFAGGLGSGGLGGGWNRGDAFPGGGGGGGYYGGGGGGGGNTFSSCDAAGGGGGGGFITSPATDPSTASGVQGGNGRVTLVVGTTTALSSSLNPSTYGQAVTFTATISPSTASGTVQFAVGGTNTGAPVAVSGGSAALTLSTTAVGQRPVTATYIPEAGYGASSALLGSDQVVNPATLTVTPHDQMISFAASDPTFTFAITGFANGEHESALTSLPTCSVTGSHSAPGPYPITCTGGTAANYVFDVSATATLTVRNPPPTLGALPSDQTVEATGRTGAQVTYTPPTATDGIDPAPVVTCAPVSGSTFPLGETTVSCSATNAAGDTSAPGTFKVTVHDTTPPTLGPLPADMVLEATGRVGATAFYPALWGSDLADPAPAVSCVPASGTTFRLGVTTVSCTARDKAGNTSAPGTFRVTVRDTTAPVLSVPADLTVEATSPAGAAVSYTTPVNDVYDPLPAINCSAASGSVFALGTTTVSCTATDRSGNTSPPSTFHVTVRDTTRPMLGALPDDQIVEATGRAGAAVTFTTPTATDLADPAPTVTCLPESASTFPLGATTVTCTATDSSGNTSVAGPYYTQVAAGYNNACSLSTEGRIACMGADLAGQTSGPNASSDRFTQISTGGGDTCGVRTDGYIRCWGVDHNGSVAGPNLTKASFGQVSASETQTCALGTGGRLLCWGNFFDNAVRGPNTSPDLFTQVSSGVRETCGVKTNQRLACWGDDMFGSVSGPNASPSLYTQVSAGQDQACGLRTNGQMFCWGVDRNGSVLRASTSGFSFIHVSTGGGVTCGVKTDKHLICWGRDTGGSVSGPNASGGSYTQVTTSGTGTCALKTNQQFDCWGPGLSASANQASETFTVTVRDTTPPSLSVPSDLTVEATGTQGAEVTYAATATDIVDPSPTVFCTPASGTTFAIGTTTVTCSATDARGNTSAPSTFHVTVPDATPPTLAGLPPDFSVEAASADGAAVTYTAPTATDQVDPSPLVSCAPASGATFPLGETTVSCSATDASGNASAPSTFKVRVRDTTAPALAALPADTTVEATGPSGALVPYAAPTATDLVDPSPTIACEPASEARFALGATTVSCTTTDATGNTSAASTFQVRVVDTTAPALAGTPTDLTVEATGPAGASVQYTAPTATDIADPSPTVTCAPPSGSTFAIGATTVSCTGTDASGNESAASTFEVTVRDTTAPSLTALPSDFSVEAAGPDGAAVTYAAPTAADLVDPSPTVSCAPASGSTFAFGTTTVSCTTSDATGNASAPSTFHVTVRDTTPPVLAGLPLGSTVEATGPSGAVVSYAAPTATDLVDPSPTVACAPASGTTFAVGVTTVWCTATDARGNESPPSRFEVTVKDTTAPLLGTIPAEMTVEATGPTGATVPYTAPTASDLVDPAPTVRCLPATRSAFALGTTTISCTATDEAGNTSAASTFQVTVQDTTPPALSLPADFSLNATSSAGAPVTYAASASDIVDGRIVITCAPLSASTFAVGTTTVTCSSTDAHGNTATGAFRITVLGPGSQLASVATSLASVGGGSFSSQLTDIQSKFQTGQTQAACNSLRAFENHVRAQSGKQLTIARANAVYADAERIRGAMGC